MPIINNKINNKSVSDDDVDVNISDNTNSIISSIISNSSNNKDANSIDNMYVSDLISSSSNISGNMNKYEYVIEYVNKILDSNENNTKNISYINKTDEMTSKEGLSFNDIIGETNLNDLNDVNDVNKESKENNASFDKISTTSSNNNLSETTTEHITNELENKDKDLIRNPEKYQVSFSQIDFNNINDINEMKPINESINKNNLFGNNSITTSSDFSYTRAIKSHRIPSLQPIFSNKNIRLTKIKSKKKIIELDEVDYLYNKLQDYRRNMIINRTNYIILIAKAMEIIEDYPDVENNNKKDTVVKALNRLVMIDLDLNEFDQRFFLSSLSNVIELIIVCTRTKANNYDKKHSNNKNDAVDDITRANCGQIIYSLVDKLTTIVLKKQYNADKLFTNVATIADILMILVDKYTYLTGNEKKMIVLQSANKFMNDKLEYIIELSPEKKDDLVYALDSISLTIDLFIALQKGKYKINKKQNMVVKKTSWIKSLCGGSKQHIDE